MNFSINRNRHTDIENRLLLVEGNGGLWDRLGV